MPSVVIGVTGGREIRLAICERGMDAVVPSSKRMVHGRSGLSSKESETLTGKGMSITVPETSMLVAGSISSTWVPGG